MDDVFKETSIGTFVPLAFGGYCYQVTLTMGENVEKM